MAGLQVKWPKIYLSIIGLLVYSDFMTWTYDLMTWLPEEVGGGEGGLSEPSMC